MAAPAHADAPVSAHAQVHTCCTPPAEMETAFRQAKALGAAYIRVDVELPYDARGLDDVIRLSKRHDVAVLGILITAPNFADAHQYGRLAGEAAGHAAGTIDRWEVLNEPDGSWAFEGTPEQYARMLGAASDAIRARAPGARVVLGGLHDPRHPEWLTRVLGTPGADALHKFDVANIHLRGSVDGVVSRYRAFSDWLAGRGFRGPVWVTELGYPADPKFQTERRYADGAASQAAYLTQALVGLGEAGARRVFVTLHDNPALLPQYVSEGIVGRPAFAATRRVAYEWDALIAWRREQRAAERGTLVELAAVFRSAGKAKSARRRIADGRSRVLEARDRHSRRRDALAFVAGGRLAVAWHTALADWHRHRADEHAREVTVLKRRIAGG